MPKLSLVKLGCPGETTVTMIDGGICTYDHGSRLEEAVAFLRASRQFVAFVTINIGANDFACADLACVPAGVASIQANLPAIPGGDWARRRIPDGPLAGHDDLQPVPGRLADRSGRPGLGSDSRRSRASCRSTTCCGGTFLAHRVSVADVEGAFSTTDFTSDGVAPRGG